MMSLRKLVLLAFLLLTVSVTVFSQEEPTIPGKIAYIGEDYNIYVYHRTADSSIIQLTGDASRSRRYQLPTWAHDGRLAYFCCDFLENLNPTLEVYISGNAQSQGKLIYQAEGEGLTYAYWSPASCEEDDSCRDLSVLVTQVGSPFKIELIRDHSMPSAQSIGEGAPYYHTWSHDGKQIAWQRNSVLLSIYDVEQDRIDDLPFRNGNAQVPIWSPIANELLLAVRGNNIGSTDLIVLSEGETRVLQQDLQGSIWLGWSPDGQYIAYSNIRENQGALIVIDAQTGEIEHVQTPLPVISFFWSPDSQKIAYLTPSQVTSPGASLNFMQPPSFMLAWSVLELETGLSRTFEGFVPSPEMLYIINFFDQFAPSHSMWSPDSRFLVYAEIVNGVQNQVNILDTSQDDTVTYPIADGVLGIWSFR